MGESLRKTPYVLVKKKKNAKHRTVYINLLPSVLEKEEKNVHLHLFA